MLITRLFPLFPADYNAMLLDKVHYDIERLKMEAMNRPIHFNMSARRRCWVLRIIFRPAYQFWFGVFVLSIVAVTLWRTIGWSFILGWIFTWFFLLYPLLFKHLVDDLIHISDGYKRYQRFLDDYHNMITEVIRVQQVKHSSNDGTSL